MVDVKKEIDDFVKSIYQGIYVDRDDLNDDMQLQLNDLDCLTRYDVITKEECITHVNFLSVTYKKVYGYHLSDYFTSEVF